MIASAIGGVLLLKNCAAVVLRYRLSCRSADRWRAPLASSRAWHRNGAADGAVVAFTREVVKRIARVSQLDLSDRASR